MKLLRALPLPLLVVLLLQPGCQTVPETGRSQLIMISSSEEAAMGLQAFSQIKQDEKVSDNLELNLRIQAMGRRIAESVGRDLPNAQWEFVVFESDQINAFALPGGKVGIYTGLINLADSDDEIAAVIGHEVAHVTSRHGAERISQAMLAGIGGIAVAVATSDNKNRDGYMLDTPPSPPWAPWAIRAYRKRKPTPSACASPPVLVTTRARRLSFGKK